jgi:hypothetical protein
MQKYLSYCGLDCVNCAIREEVLCEGCRDSDNTYWGGICEIKECAVHIQKVENCSYCKKFPCEILLDISFDPETGDDGARIERLKELSDKEVTPFEKIRTPLIGALLGGILGLIIGAFAENVLSWFFALGGGDVETIAQSGGSLVGYVIGGIIVGAAVAIIRVINRKEN